MYFLIVYLGVGSLVYALKSYNNNQPYRREEEKNVLNLLIQRFSKETTSPYEKKSFVDKSVQNLVNNSIIEGYFPKENVVKQMAIKRFNKMLCVIMGLLIGLVIVSYYFVITCEVKLNDLSRQTVLLNNENAELQNKLDTLKSFNNVDKTLEKNNMLQRAGQVIETQEITVDPNSIPKPVKKKVFNYAIGF